MRLVLTPHPETPSAAIAAIEVEGARLDRTGLELRYSVRGDIGRLLTPVPAAPERTDGLWQATCFEAFLRPDDGAAYYEFNFAPSSQWAAYAFDAYRAGMRPLALEAPRIDVATSDDLYEVSVAFEWPLLAQHARLRVALTAVIEDVSGGKSYWALKHAPGKPDFHHADGFAVELP